MAIPQIISIDQTTGVCDTDGGIVYSHGMLCSNFTGVTVDAAGNITGFTTAVTGNIGKLQYDTEEDVPYFNETGERTGKKHLYNQEAFMSFDGITADKIKAGDSAAAGCCNIFIHTFANGVKRMQGIQVDKDTGDWTLSKKRALVTVNNNSNTGDATDRMEWTISSQSKYAAPVVAMTDAAIEAL